LIITLGLCTFAVLLGVANVFVLYHTYTSDPRKFKKFRNACTFSCCPETRFFRVVASAIFLLVGCYGIVFSLAFRVFFARYAYDHACDKFSLMAEVEIMPDFGFEGVAGAPTTGTSSRIRYYVDGKYMYSMDLIRAYNMTFGFSQYAYDSDERLRNLGNEEWGALTLALVLPEGGLWQGAGGTGVEASEQHISVFGMVHDQLRGKNTTMPGPVGKVSFSLLNSTWGYPLLNHSPRLTSHSYQTTFTNTSTPGFPPVTTGGSIDFALRGLAYPQLHLRTVLEDRDWRFTDRVCLPPQVRLKDPFLVEEEVRGEFAWDCRRYR
jgi:hypothetical protein